MIIKRITGFLLLTGSITALKGQDRCGSMEVMKHTFQRRPLLKANFEQQTQRIQKAVKERKTLANARVLATTTYVPIVFHIVLPIPSLVTDAQIKAQLDKLNEDYAGLNADTVLIPVAFKSRFGKTSIQFKLAQRTPYDEPSTGIERITTSHTSFKINDTSLKYTALGGADAWDPNRFFNIWITDLSQGYLGYSTFPGSGPDVEDGVVIKYTSLLGGIAPYDKGRTLVHETGHFFYLYHIWGDEDGCGGTDFIDDTPNQETSTTGCPHATVVTDACTTTAPGIMYENYMDYTNDACMALFTSDQVDRMETSLILYRTPLLTSNGADPVIINDNLRAKGFLVTPNPSAGSIAVRFFPHLPYIKSITIFNSYGQQVTSRIINGLGSSSYSFDLSQLAGGMYIVRVMLPDKVLTQKIIKR